MLDTIREFLERGGQVIVLIAWVIFVMWTLIIERLLYLQTAHAHRVNRMMAPILARPDHGSWAYEAVRTGTISEIGQRLQAGIPLIRTLAAVCPLLGLLGTVSGMIVIFDVMAAMGNSSPRAVAGGVAQATMTTMAGMVGALSGVFPAAYLGRQADQKLGLLRNESRFVVERPVLNLPPLRLGTRIPVALVSALVITLALVYGMQRLIETGKAALTDDTSIFMVDFVRIQRDESLETKELKPDKPPPPDVMPDTQVEPQMSDENVGAVQVNFSRGGLQSGLEMQGIGVSGYEAVDGEYLPLVKITPIYPRRAQARGLNGWVVLRFTITETGTVKDVEVVESSNAWFERAAIMAALKFKYRPRVVNGVPMEVTGVLHSFVFEIQD